MISNDLHSESICKHHGNVITIATDEGLYLLDSSCLKIEKSIRFKIKLEEVHYLRAEDSDYMVIDSAVDFITVGTLSRGCLGDIQKDAVFRTTYTLSVYDTILKELLPDLNHLGNILDLKIRQEQTG